MRLHWLVPFLLFCTLARAGGLTPTKIDEALEAAQAAAGVTPVPLCDDATFLRRASLDVRGVIPTRAEVDAFLADKTADKRARTIEEFLKSTERSNHWADYWDRILVGSYSEQGDEKRVLEESKVLWHQWVVKQYDANVPYTKFVQDVVTAEGPVDRVPAGVPVARWKGEPQDVAGTMSRVFLGMQIQCAQCHNHPYNKSFTQVKFWENASFFGGTDVRMVRNSAGRPVTAQVIERNKPTMVIPEKTPAVTVSPKYRDGTPLDPSKGETAREQFSRCLTEKDQRQLAANLVNRVWARYFGRGFVEPVDDWFGNPEPTTPAVLDALVEDLINSGFDQRHLESLILNTQTYQRAGKATGQTRENPELFAAAAVRPLTPEQLLDSLAEATQLPEIAEARATGKGVRAIQRLLDRYEKQFIFTFGSDEMEFTNTFDQSIPQTLFLLNDDLVNTLVSNTRGSLVATALAETKDTAGRVAILYKSALGRPPSIGEQQFFVSKIDRLRAEAKKSDAKAEAAIFEDALWALVNSTEFMTNH